jgi:hypothetical protein
MYKILLISKMRDALMKSTIMRIILISFLLVFFIPNLISAELKTFIKEYSYQASDFDSKITSRTIALEQVKRVLLEELGSYLESNTEVRNFELSKDKITALVAGVVKTHILEEKWDGKSYWMKAEIKADPENIARSIDTLRKDQKKIDELEERIRKQDEALKEIDKLKNEVVSLKKDIKAQENFNKSIATLQKEEVHQGYSSITVNQITPKKQIPPLNSVKRSTKTKKVIASKTIQPKYVASKNSNKYHYPDCKWAKKINPAKKVTFISANKARQAGYMPCKVCKPLLND